MPEMPRGQRFAPPTLLAHGDVTWACAACPARGATLTQASALARLEHHHATRHAREGKARRWQDP